jgi:O-antigen/teichoic acid export membrane protein
MGIIQKQGSKSSLFLLIGFIIGGINTIFLFPKIFTQTEYGLTRALVDTATILSVLATLGTTPVIYKFFPYYKSLTNHKQNDLPMVTGFVCLIGFIIICISGYVFKDFIIRKLGKSPLFAENFYLVYPYAFFMLVFIWLESFGWALKRTVTTNFLRETFVRIFATLLIFFVWLKIISTAQFMKLFSLTFVLPSLILLVVLIRTREWRITFKISNVTRRFKVKMFTFGLYVFGATFLNIASKTVDSFMIIGLKGLDQTAIFIIASYLVTFMDLPVRSLHSIATPIISESWKEKNYNNISTIYHKSTVTLLIAGLFVYLIAMLNINNLTQFLGAAYATVPSIVLIMGIAKLVDLGTGVNGQIISTSINWRFDFYTNVILTIISFPLNYFMIKNFGIIGAAFSNLIAISVFNFIRLFFIWKKYGWQPYSLKHIKILSVSLLIFGLVYMIPFVMNIYVDTIIRSILFTGLFIPAIYYIKVSEEINDMVEKVVQRFKG